MGRKMHSLKDSSTVVAHEWITKTSKSRISYID